MAGLVIVSRARPDQKRVQRVVSAAALAVVVANVVLIVS